MAIVSSKTYTVDTTIAHSPGCMHNVVVCGGKAVCRNCGQGGRTVGEWHEIPNVGTRTFPERTSHAESPGRTALPVPQEAEASA